jgi:hypothetical protein
MLTPLNYRQLILVLLLSIVKGKLSQGKLSQYHRRLTMFGQMQVTYTFALSKRETVDEAVAKLLQFTDHPNVVRWFQFPTALVVFLAHDDAPDCGAIYVYDRKRCTWLWVDFDDRNYGGYSPEHFDVLINQCHFFGLVESPGLLDSPVQWLVTPGQKPTVLGRLPA